MVQLFVDNQELDMMEDVVIPINYSISDVKAPDKLKRSYSKTIVLPGTKKNNAFFHSAYNMGLTELDDSSVGFKFDPTLSYDALLLEDGHPIMRGSINLEKTIIRGNQKEYHVTLYSEIATFFQGLGNITIAELGWSEYDFTLSVANIAATWSAATGSDVWYPVIDYGYATDPTIYKTNELRAFVYVKEILQKMCAYVGKTLESDFFDTTRMKKLVWGSGGGNDVTISAAEVTAREADYTGDGSESYSFNNTFYNPLTLTWGFGGPWTMPLADNDVLTMTLVTDTYTQYDTTTGEFIAQNTGKYKVTISVDLLITYGFDVPPATADIDILFYLYIKKNGALIQIVNEEVVDTAAGSATVTLALTQELDLEAGDIISAYFVFGPNIKAYFTPSTNKFNFTIDFNNDLSFNVSALDASIVDGDTVIIANQLPVMKAKDLLKDLITMFNLYISEPSDEGVIKIEPLVDYYLGTDDVDDWSNKLSRDAKHPIEVKAASTIEGKEYLWKYAEDRDFYKQRYYEDTGIDYGDRVYTVPSTFKKGERVYKLNCAQSVPVGIEGSSLVIPRILKYDDATGVTGPYNGKPRMFFNCGLVSGVWGLVNSDTLLGTGYSTYPAAHHLDSLTSPTLDLNFAKPSYVFYVPSAYTDANLSTEYHLQFIRELTGRDSKLLNGYFKLTPSDLYLNFMRRLCIIDGVVYRKNLIKDYRANNKELTKVELVRVAEANNRQYGLSNATPDSTSDPVLPFGFGGDTTDPITTDTNVRAFQTNYPVDTTSGDVTITADVATMTEGQTFTVTKTNVGGGKVIISPTDSTGLTTPLIVGQSDIKILQQWDAYTVFFDGEETFTLR